MVSLDIGDIVADFPDYRVALFVSRDLRVDPRLSPGLASVIEAKEQAVANWLAGIALAEVPACIDWRQAYKAMGVKKTSYRSSVERLLKAVQRGGGLPRVNSLVDTYNAVSVTHQLCVGADDLAKLRGGLAFRYARPGDRFFALGDGSARDDPPKPGEVVYADAEKLLCRRWNWYQDQRSAISNETSDAVLTLQGLAAAGDKVEIAARDLAGLLAEHCGAQCRWEVAERGRPKVEV